ncbi:MAG: protein translocase subunit SecD [Pseudobdellovibrionaceae bacterium]
MNKQSLFRIILVAIAIIVGVIYTTPSLMNINPETSNLPYKKKVNLGLDLQGGLYMVFEINLKDVFDQTMKKTADGIHKRAQEKGMTVTVKKSETKTDFDDPRIVLEFPAGSKDQLEKLIGDDYFFVQVLTANDTNMEIGMSIDHRNDIRTRTLSQSIQVVRNRIDEFGVTEPNIVSQGNNRIVVELPGVKDIERAKELVGRTAKLEFKIVNEEKSEAEVAALIAQLEKDNSFSYKEGDRFSAYVAKINELAAGKIPAETVIAFGRNDNPNAPKDSAKIPYLLTSKTEVSGEDLIDAQVQYDEYGNPNVGFQLDAAAAGRFGELTSKNVGKRLAIVLDGLVYSAPNIQSRISDRGQITLGRGNVEQTMKEAKDLSIVLRAGALPAQLELAEQRSIGPSLGADSIKKGVNAGLIGCLLVFALMLIYYRMSGAIAIFSLILNVTLVFAAFVMLGATLTLPGIAGLALTVGMAVDSNIIIFERIRDELREGGSVKASVERGFDRAFTCIFDANITHLIIAIILIAFGTGPIRGFAVTLIVGVFTTLFCAVTVCKLCFDLWVGNNPDKKTLSI